MADVPYVLALLAGAVAAVNPAGSLCCPPISRSSSPTPGPTAAAPPWSGAPSGSPAG